MKAYKNDSKTPIKKGKKVVVVGGGNVAMDAARTALRFGSEVHVVYRRSEEELPARKEEVEHAKQEGVIFNLLNNPVEILGDENGDVCGVKVVKMQLGQPDLSGRRKPIAIEGSEYVIDADTVIMAIGTCPNPLLTNSTKSLEVNAKKCILTDENLQTTREGVFAGGDAVTGSATVILAMSAGKKAAKSIGEYLKSKIK
jgi:glutamate synthase (NADPH/NADH) small chain